MGEDPRCRGVRRKTIFSRCCSPGLIPHPSSARWKKMFPPPLQVSRTPSIHVHAQTSFTLPSPSVARRGTLVHFLPSQRGQRKKVWNVCDTMWARCAKGFERSPLRRKKVLRLGHVGEVVVMKEEKSSSVCVFLHDFSEEEKILSWIRRYNHQVESLMEAKWRRRK